MIKRRNLDPSIRGLIDGDMPRRQLHVCKSDAGNVNYLRENAPYGLYHTIQGAMAEAQAYDDIIVWPGVWNETGVIAITQHGLRLRAALSGPGMAMSRQTSLWQDDAATNTAVISVEGAYAVEICGFTIGPYVSADGIGIEVGLTVATRGTYIHDNFFFTQEVADGPTFIELGSSSYDAQSTCIAFNDFYGGSCNVGDSAQIRWDNATRSRVMGNTFMLLGNTTTYSSIRVAGADHVERGWIIDNVFACMEVAGGVKFIDAAAATVGNLFIDGNSFIGAAATTNCFTWNADFAGINYRTGAAITS